MSTETESTTATEAKILRADDERFAAMLRRDMPALDSALEPELTYVHSTARFETKAEHLANVRDGKPYYRGIAPRERHVRLVGGAGVITGMSEMHTERDGNAQRFTIRYLAVYAREGERWRLAAWQSTRLP